MATPNFRSFDGWQASPPLNPRLAAKTKVQPLTGPATDPALLREDHLRLVARSEARSWTLSAVRRHRTVLEKKWKDANQSICTAIRDVEKNRQEHGKESGDARFLLENTTLIMTALREAHDDLRAFQRIPQVERSKSDFVPRIYLAVEKYLHTVKYDADRYTFLIFLAAAQEDSPFSMPELCTLKSCMQLALLECISSVSYRSLSCSHEKEEAVISRPVCDVELQKVIDSLRLLVDLDWNEVFEEVSVTHGVLLQDPLGTYSKMDLESRGIYRNAVEELAAHSPLSEQDIARKAVALAREPQDFSSPQARERRSQAGYYLLGEGKKILKESIGYRLFASEWVQQIILNYPDFFYLLAIELGILAILFLAIAGSRVKYITFWDLALFAIPAIECAVAVVNLLATQIVHPRIVPRLDFSKGIPVQNAAMVVVPALLTSKDQVEHAVKDLEIRFLANRDSNLYFGLITDLPDSSQQFDEKDSLAQHCSNLIESLNAKYAGEAKGSFFLFHRNRVYNPSEEIWMGWERKRGKLLDFNNLLLNKNDNFPVKIGDLAVLRKIKYVITLDLDTQLPRDSARKLVEALAHPLNRAVIDPEKNIVVEGYGILQPRVGISVKSASRSRLAALFSADTGFDIYTRAISDVYYDLFGEGIFAGKGIYEVETFQRVLENRFPCNAILSHDLIEGTYARASLVSDVEVIDDYPSHVSAYSLRKHRWIRGDWQICLWLLPRVPDYFGRIVRNPIRLLSRWKIFDNLRRSLTEFATFVLILYGFFLPAGKVLPWTLASLAILIFPAYLQFVISVARSGGLFFTAHFWKDAISSLLRRHADLLFRLILLCHQSLVTLDAIVRAIVRMAVTHKRLLQWETAAQVEMQKGTDTPFETYLAWSLLLSISVGILLASFRPDSLLIALPFLVLWGSSQLFCSWLDRPLCTVGTNIKGKEQAMLRDSALRTWRFFNEFSTPEDNWLVPDAIQHAPTLIAHRVSPTNLGLLLNARLAAYDLGFVTLPELVEATERTLDTAGRMEKHNGHFYNWYDTLTLEPVAPRFVSSVDSGNLVCCLWTLKQAFAEAGRGPLFTTNLWQGIHDHAEILRECVENGRNEEMSLSIRGLCKRLEFLGLSSKAWIGALPRLEIEALNLEEKLAGSGVGNPEIKWWAHELATRMTKAKTLVEAFAPWLLPQFAQYCRDGEAPENSFELYTLESLRNSQAAWLVKVETRLQSERCTPEIRFASDTLLSMLMKSAMVTRDLANKLAVLSGSANSLAKNMDFAFLYNPQKKMLSIGYDSEQKTLSKCYYDLLASEARSAVFVAIAKGDIPQESWFKLGRTQCLRGNARMLLSWSGTMFEYLLPSLWMKFYPSTVLEQSSRLVVRAQQEAARARSIPWGISESSCIEKNPDGYYRYHPFGLPSIALGQPESADLVISPYSSFLALSVAGSSAAKNIGEMKALGWLGTYGFFDACDFSPSRMGPGNKFEVVHCWMAHHQGMSLVAAANAICESSSQRRFHEEPFVAATERLLQEKFVLIPNTEGGVEPELDSSALPFPVNPKLSRTGVFLLTGDSALERNQ